MEILDCMDEITKYGDKVLRTATEPVVDFNEETRSLIQHMYEVLAEAKGLGLAANQIGVSKRLFVYDIGEGPKALVNPRLVKSSGEQTGVEGCLSIPNLQGEVSRAETVVVEGLDEEGKPVKIKAEGLLARVFQHELDHLDGVFFVDRADPETLEFVHPTEKDAELEERE